MLGPTSEVQTFDKARKRRKDNPTDYTCNAYLDILAIIETRISCKITNLNEELKAWERRYFADNNQLPSGQDAMLDATAKSFVDRIKYGKALMRSWRKKYTHTDSCNKNGSFKSHSKYQKKQTKILEH